MIILTQLIFVASALAMLVYLLGNRKTYVGKACKKLALIFLLLTMIVVAFFPDLTTQAANIIGIGRGADLLLYITIVAFVFFILNNYLQQQDQRDVTYRLARKIALIEANAKYSIKK